MSDINHMLPSGAKPVIADREGFYTMLCTGIRGKYAKDSQPIEDNEPPTAEIVEMCYDGYEWAETEWQPKSGENTIARGTGAWWKKDFRIKFRYADTGIAGLSACQYRIGVIVEEQVRAGQPLLLIRRRNSVRGSGATEHLCVYN